MRIKISDSEFKAQSKNAGIIVQTLLPAEVVFFQIYPLEVPLKLSLESTNIKDGVVWKTRMNSSKNASYYYAGLKHTEIMQSEEEN